MTLTFIIILMHHKWYNFITTIELSTFFNRKNKPVGLTSFEEYDKAAVLEHFRFLDQKIVLRSDNTRCLETPGLSFMDGIYI